MADRLPLVLLHGWGFDHHIWDDLLPLLQPQVECIALDLPGFAPGDAPVADMKAATAMLLPQLPPRCVLLGWSLGGMLATHIAIHHPQRIAGLITVGSNLKWVGVDEEKENWPGALPDNFASFFENLAHNFAGTQQHFCGVIARGDREEKSQSRLLRRKLSSVPTENFLAGLRLLDAIDNRKGFAQLQMPGLHVLGQEDVMVPLSVADLLPRINFRQKAVVMSGCAHQPFLTEPQEFADSIVEFIASIPYQLDKKHIALSFSKAASTYDQAARLQREIGDQLISSVTAPTPRRVLDLGCGTGHYTERLQKQFPHAEIFALDLAEGMLSKTGDRCASALRLCADAEHLPLADQTVELIYSNLAIQWCQDIPQLFQELQRVLTVDGYALLSTFVDGTLCELRDSWQQVDSKIHVNSFAYAEKIKAAAESAGFFSIAIRQETLVRYYDSVKQLNRELKQIGAHNLNAGRAAGLTGKNALQRMQDVYELQRVTQGLPAHYEVLYLELRKTSEKDV